MIGVDDNTFVSGTFSPLYWGLPVIMLFRNNRAPPAYAPALIAGATALWIPLYYSDAVRDVTKYFSRALTWRAY